ncbi:hypothetical protein ACQ5SP_06285 [Rhodovulum sp. YNF3179]|uniref:hypothetical protein n=1 Tax=Rhodovulum sp. YNF3179 TaxID=3425127 RepID=UPI003D359A5F
MIWQWDPRYALLLLTPFVVIFLWAARIELTRWWKYGPSENRRADFPIDENAPSYEPPPGEDGDDESDETDHTAEKRQGEP